jgi:hypothetical protein
MGRSWLIVAALCCVLVGCGDDGEDGATTPAPAAAPEETAEATETAAPTETAEGTAAEPTTTAEPATEDPLAMKTVKSNTRKTATLDIAVQSLSVNGKLATLELAFTPHDTDPASYDDTTIEELHGPLWSLQITLIDPVNLKRYVVVNDTEDNDLESDLVNTRPEPDGTAVTAHTFAAPPPDVTEIDVAVGSFVTFRNVPIAR